MHRYASVVMRHATAEYANIGWLMDQPITAALRPALNSATDGRFDGSPDPWNAAQVTCSPHETSVALRKFCAAT